MYCVWHVHSIRYNTNCVGGDVGYGHVIAGKTIIKGM